MAAPKQPTDQDKHIAQPLTAAALAAYGELPAPPPAGSFDPHGEWEQTYRIWLTGGPWDSYCGQLSLRRTKGDEGNALLHVSEVTVMPRTRSARETVVDLTCRDDALATPVRWQLCSRVFDLKTDETFEETTVEQTGVATDAGATVTTGGHQRTYRLGAAWTSNWSLFEAVPRLPRKAGSVTPFDLLDDLDSPKLGHRLLCRGAEAFPGPESETPATRFDQLGSGCLPCRYYVDAAGRLLLAHTELRAYILDPESAATYEQKRKWIAGKEMK